MPDYLFFIFLRTLAFFLSIQRNLRLRFFLASCCLLIIPAPDSGIVLWFYYVLYDIH